MCFPVKKDAEGWETVQRGRTAKPRSATIAVNASPVSARSTSKRDSTKAMATQPHVVPQVQELHRYSLNIGGGGQTSSEEQVLANTSPVDSVGDSENRDMMEVLWFSIL